MRLQAIEMIYKDIGRRADERRGRRAPTSAPAARAAPETDKEKQYQLGRQSRVAEAIFT